MALERGSMDMKEVREEEEHEKFEIREYGHVFISSARICFIPNTSSRVSFGTDARTTS